MKVADSNVRRRLVASLRGDRVAEALGFALLMAIATALRVVKLGTIPRIIAADETDNLQDAYHVIAGTGPGLFGFDWKPAPIFSVYQLAWTIRLFGDSVADFRMYAVILSLLTAAGFYAVARRSMGAPAAQLSMILLITNLTMIHFSRTAWENMNAALFALGACYTTQRALTETGGGRTWAGWWTSVGIFAALGLYGYFSGRFIFLSVVLVVGLAIVLRQTRWRDALTGLLLAGFVSAVFFAPMANKIARDWDLFNQRTNNVSVFSIPSDQPYEGETDAWRIIRTNVVRNLRTFALQNGSQIEHGYNWQRYNPRHRAPLDHMAATLFFLGVAVSVVRWRKAYTWWPFIVPLAVSEVFSTNTPDIARGLIFVPFYFLLIGLLFDEVLQRMKVPLAKGAVALGAFGLVVFVGVGNVVDYFQWQDKQSTQISRMPGVDSCEFALWQDMARDAAEIGETEFLNRLEFDLRRKKLGCSEIVRIALDRLPPVTAP